MSMLTSHQQKETDHSSCFLLHWTKVNREDSDNCHPLQPMWQCRLWLRKASQAGAWWHCRVIQLSRSRRRRRRFDAAHERSRSLAPARSPLHDKAACPLTLNWRRSLWKCTTNWAETKNSMRVVTTTTTIPRTTWTTLKVLFPAWRTTLAEYAADKIAAFKRGARNTVNIFSTISAALEINICTNICDQIICLKTISKMTVRGTMVRSEVCNSWCFCLES